MAIGRLIEEQERPKVAARKSAAISAARRGEIPVKNRNLETRDVVAKAVGMSGTGYYKAKQVVEAAESDPERFGDLPAKPE